MNSASCRVPHTFTQKDTSRSWTDPNAKDDKPKSMMVKTYQQPLVLLLLHLLFSSILYPQDSYHRNTVADVLAYDFHLELNDSTDHIVGRADITIDVKDEAIPFALDLIGKNGLFGMEVMGVQENGADIPYAFVENKIGIAPSSGKTTIRTYTISYNGMPERGLVIDSTKFGERSFSGTTGPTLHGIGFRPWTILTTRLHKLSYHRTRSL